MTDSHFLFVYGTLMRNAHHPQAQHFHQAATFLGPAKPVIFYRLIYRMTLTDRSPDDILAVIKLCICTGILRKNRKDKSDSNYIRYKKNLFIGS